jgi:hypothetical protein
MSSLEIRGSNWAAESTFPFFSPPTSLEVYDIHRASLDTKLTVTTLTGLINRAQPRVYLLESGDDAFWLRSALSSVPRSAATAIGEAVLDALVERYRDVVRGLIVYDPRLADTINVATTLAGQRDAIVVAPQQVQHLHSAFELSPLVDLRNYGWRTRLQAYDWAYHNLLPTASTRLVAGLNPVQKSLLRSFLVATRTFVYWLDARSYLPDLSEGVQSERGLMQRILSHFDPGAAHLGWFIDESSGVQLTSKAALPVLASDHFTNLEVWTAVKSQGGRRDFSAPTKTPEKDKVYVSFTFSDGDNLQYDQHRMLHLWEDRLRGSFPVGWTLSPLLIEAAPAIAAYYARTATSNDEFIAGPSGAGYIFPSEWPDEQLDAFLERTGRFMQDMNMRVLEVLDEGTLQSSGLPLLKYLLHTGMSFTNEARQDSYVRVLAPYGLRGIISGAGVSNGQWKIVDGVPLYHNVGLAYNADKAFRLITHAARAQTARPLFLNVYLLAWNITLADVQRVIERLGAGYQVVLPGTLLRMLRELPA